MSETWPLEIARRVVVLGGLVLFGRLVVLVCVVALGSVGPLEPVVVVGGIVVGATVVGAG